MDEFLDGNVESCHVSWNNITSLWHIIAIGVIMQVC